MIFIRFFSRVIYLGMNRGQHSWDPSTDIVYCSEFRWRYSWLDGCWGRCLAGGLPPVTLRWLHQIHRRRWRRKSPRMLAHRNVLSPCSIQKRCIKSNVSTMCHWKMKWISFGIDWPKIVRHIETTIRVWEWHFQSYFVGVKNIPIETDILIIGVTMSHGYVSVSFGSSFQRRVRSKGQRLPFSSSNVHPISKSPFSNATGMYATRSVREASGHSLCFC